MKRMNIDCFFLHEQYNNSSVQSFCAIGISALIEQEGERCPVWAKYRPYNMEIVA